jgi:hypothetical protein
VSEEALAAQFGERRERGRYFTPGSLADFVVEQVAAQVPDGRLAIVDPSCGAGAFLAAARRRWPRANLFGLELSAEAAAHCARRLPGATVLTGDAFRGGLECLLGEVPPGAFELWVGNPPYNGTSPVMTDKKTYANLQALMPAALPRGTSLRDDYAFFLLLARRRLVERPGALAFVTSASLLDSFLYAPLRQTLLESLALTEVVELGAGAFAGTRVRTCITLWRSRGSASPKPRYRRRRVEGPFDATQVGPPASLRPVAPEWLLRPPDTRALELDAHWRERGEPLSALVPITLPGLKTRFDELLVDADPERLLKRMAAFLACRPARLSTFATTWSIPGRCDAKLAALKAAADDASVTPDASAIRPFFRYAGARHRGRIPDSARAFCYLDRRLIPRGDHRLRGPYDPHACVTKLVFNVRELPLSAAFVDSPGCVHDHQHSRFAPLHVPERIWREGLGSARKGPLGPDVWNLSERGRAWARRRGGPDAAFRAIAGFINSEPVQRVWAPAWATSRELFVPLADLR